MNLNREDIEKELSLLKDPKSRIDRMNHYASLLFRKDDDWFKVLSGKALVLARAEGYEKGIAQALLIKAFYYYKTGQYETMLSGFAESEQIMRSIPGGSSLGLHRLLNCKAGYYMELGNYPQAIEIYEEAITISRELGDLPMLANIYSNLSEIYNALGQPDRALAICLDAAGTIRPHEHPMMFVFIYNNAALFSLALKKYADAAGHLEKAMALIREFDLPGKEAVILSTYSKLYLQTGDYDRAKQSLHACLKLEKKLPEAEVTSLMRLGSLHLTLGEYEEARKYLDEALECALRFERYHEEKEIHTLLEQLNLTSGDYKKAHYHLKQAFELQEMINRIEVNSKIQNLEDDALRRANKRIQTISAMGQKITSNLDMSLVLDNIYHTINVLMNARLFGIITYNKELDRLESEFSIKEGKKAPVFSIRAGEENSFVALVFREKRDIIIGDLENEYKLYFKNAADSSQLVFSAVLDKKPQSLICTPLVIGNDIIGVIAVGSYKKNSYSLSDLDSIKALASYVAIALKNASQSRLIKQQNSRLGQANHKLEEINRQIISSIGYARKIQSSILPPTSIIQNSVSGFFLLYQPRDIIGGDFYWFREDTKGLLCVVGDCTGHGIPGAFMSMAVTTLLTKLNDDHFYANPALLLSHLNSYLKKTLKQDGKSSLSQSDDGADVGICFNPAGSSSLVFAGAGMSLFYGDKQGIHEVAGDKMSIGYRESTAGFPFTNHTVTLDHKVRYYMTTDGYIDQIGGPKTLPLGRKKFMALLGRLSDLPMHEQKVLLEEEMRSYRGPERQIDDITVLGFRL